MGRKAFGRGLIKMRRIRTQGRATVALFLLGRESGYILGVSPYADDPSRELYGSIRKRGRKTEEITAAMFRR